MNCASENQLVAQFGSHIPQRLKPLPIMGIYGTTKVVPFQTKSKLATSNIKCMTADPVYGFASF
jgi:hypothetical protein